MVNARIPLLLNACITSKLSYLYLPAKISLSVSLRSMPLFICLLHIKQLREKSCKIREYKEWNKQCGVITCRI